MFRFSLIATALLAAGLASAQTQSPTIGGNGNLDQQVIGDTANSADHTASTSNQLGNSANNNGASISVPTDIRTQISPNMDSTATGGSAIGNQSSNDNKSSASNGNQSMGQANTGNSAIGNTSSNSGGNNLTNGSNTANNAAAGGAGGAGGQGGAASSNGTNAQGQGQQQANTGTNAQGQTSANRNTAGGNTGGNSANTVGQSTTAGNGAGAGAGSGNRTANTTRVDASDRSVTNNSYKAVAWAPIIPGPVAPALATANLVVIPGQCGPRVRVVATNVVGKQFGPFGGQYDVMQGIDTDTVMAQGADGQYEPYVVIGDDVWGQRVDRAIGAIGTSSSTNFSVGGFSSKGDAAQGGAGGSGSLQQIVARSFVTDCVIGKVIKPAEPKVQVVFESAIPRPARADRN